MKRLLTTAASAFALAMAAEPTLAADIPTKAPVYSAPMFDWTGFYGGVHAGYAWGNSNWTSLLTGTSIDWRNNGPFGGLHAGYNLQSGPLVVGLQTEISGSSVSGDGFLASTGARFTSKLRWFGSVDARLGLASDRTLLYAIGGYTLGKIPFTVSEGAVFVRVSDTHHGWNIGAGVEHAVTESWSARIEYRYYDFKSKSYPFIAPVIQHKRGMDMHTVRVGMSYKFATGKAPIMTRY